MKEIVRVEYSGFGVAFDSCAWFNATEAAEHFGKRASHWIMLQSTLDYIQVLNELSAQDSNSNAGKSGISKWIKTRRGQNGGTWMHPDLAVRFAQWLDVRFAVWCDRQIKSLLTREHPWYEWRDTRHTAIATHKALSQMLTMAREAQGKETVAYHHSNEAKMVNWCLTGIFAGLDRDKLSRADLDMLGELETLDMLQLASGASYEARKQALAQRAEEMRAKRQTPQLGCKPSPVQG